MSGLCQDIVELRRGDHSGARLEMERTRLEREREQTEEEVVAHFQRWAKNPAVREWICRDWITPEERARRIREIYGLPPELAEAGTSTTPGSNPVKPNPTQSTQSRRMNMLNKRRAVRPFVDAGKLGQSWLNRASGGGRVTPHSAATTDGVACFQ